MVSRSRISPTRITSGSWRRALRSAWANDTRVDADLALVDDRPLVAMRNSIGSSMVMMWSVSVGVDVVDHRRQRGGLARAGGAGDQDQPALLQRDLLEDRRQHSSPMLWMREGMTRSTSADRAALLEDVDAEAAQPRHRVGEVDLDLFLNFSFWRSLMMPKRHRDRVFLHQALQIRRAGRACRRRGSPG